MKNELKEYGWEPRRQPRGSRKRKSSVELGTKHAVRTEIRRAIKDSLPNDSLLVPILTTLASKLISKI